LEHDADAQWCESLPFVEPTALSTDQVLEVHDEECIQLLFSGEMPAAKMRRIGFPWSEQLITPNPNFGGGTVETAKQAIEHGIALHLSGGYHHAHKGFGSGFCLINDLVLAAHEALKSESIDKVLIVDADVHHGAMERQPYVKAERTSSRCHSIVIKTSLPESRRRIWMCHLPAKSETRNFFQALSKWLRWRSTFINRI
jgi:hypothetical protein